MTMKKFNTPEINSVELNSVEAIMDSNMLVQPGANDVGGKAIKYSITDADRKEADKQKYWSGK